MSAGQIQRFKFSRSARIQRSGDFARLRGCGERMVSGCLLVNWRRLDAGAPSRLGIVTSRKLGSAVVRNRIRRLLRESFRLHQHELAGPLDLVLVPRSGMAGKRFAEVETNFLTMLRKARLLKRD